MACQPFYRDAEAPIWYGRVTDMQPIHQRIFVYGFVTSAKHEQYKDMLVYVDYSMQMRAKNENDEEWTYLNPDEPF